MLLSILAMGLSPYVLEIPNEVFTTLKSNLDLLINIQSGELRICIEK